MSTHTIVVPTYNRPDDLERCLASIAEQTLLPDELLVIDDGDLPALPHRERLEQLGIRCELRKKPHNEKGLTRSRNLGVELASGDIIHFFDDDITLEPDYVEQMDRTFQTCGDPNLGGVGGIDLLIPAPTTATYLEYFYNRLFLLTPRRPGSISISGFSELQPARRCFPAKKLTRVDMLNGIFSFRREVFEQFRFGEHYTDGYCQGEDKEFTLRVSQTFSLYLQPAARCKHHHSPVERHEKFERGKHFVLAAYALSGDTKRGQILFFHAWSGYFLKKFLAACVKRDAEEFQRVRG
ncbi:MAG: glycosyltransferase family A protein, partial [bacterium]